MEIEWSLVLFTVFSGAGAWLFVACALGELFNKDEKITIPELIVALALLIVGGLFSVTHLSHPDKILNALTHPTSGIFVEALFLGILCAVIGVYGILILRNASKTALKTVAVIGLILGVIFSYICGSSYMMAARPTWNIATLPLAYLGTAAAAGTAVNLLVKTIQKRERASLHFAGVLSLSGGALGIVTALVYYISTSGGVFTGTGTLFVWTIGLFVALVLVCVCSALFLKYTEKGIGFAVVAVLGGLFGATALRVTMWLFGIGILDFFNKI